MKEGFCEHFSIQFNSFPFWNNYQFAAFLLNAIIYWTIYSCIDNIPTLQFVLAYSPAAFKINMCSAAADKTLILIWKVEVKIQIRGFRFPLFLIQFLPIPFVSEDIDLHFQRILFRVNIVLSTSFNAVNFSNRTVSPFVQKVGQNRTRVICAEWWTSPL